MSSPDLRRLLDPEPAARLLSAAAALAPCELSLLDRRGHLMACADDPALTVVHGDRRNGASGPNGTRLTVGVAAWADQGGGSTLTIAPPEPEVHVADVLVDGVAAGSVRAESTGEHGTAEAVARATAALASELAAERASGEATLDDLSEELLGRYEEITLLYDLARAFGSVFDEAGLCNIALERTLFAIEATRGFVALVDEASGGLTVAAVEGEYPPLGAELPRDEGISGSVATTGRPVLVHEDKAAPVSSLGAGPRLGEAVLSVPIAVNAEGTDEAAPPLGVLTLVGGADAYFTAGQAKLASTIVDQLAGALRTSRLVGSLREAEGLRRELEIAADIQQNLLPNRPPEVNGLLIAGCCVPAANVGGDYYDFLVDREGRLHVLLADVSGHSIGSALMMAMARNLLRREMAAGASPADVLAVTNASMYEDLARAGHFITMFCARYDPVARRLQYANGGHNPPFVHTAVTGATADVEADGAALGIFPEYPFEQRDLALAPGDRLVLYTDGVVEALAPSEEPYGEDRLRTLVADQAPGAPAQLNQRIFDDVRRHAGGAAQRDDVTIVTLEAAA